MQWKQFGLAVAVAGLLAGLPIAPGEVGEESHGRTGIADDGLFNHFGVFKGILVVDSAGDKRADARKIRSARPENDSADWYSAVPPTTRGFFLGDPPVVDPASLQSALDQGPSNDSDQGPSNDSAALASAVAPIPPLKARPSPPAPAPSSRSLTLRSHAPSRVDGCARCAAQVASAGRTKPFVGLFSVNFLGKGASVRPRHVITGTMRGREANRLAVSTVQRGWRTPSL